MSRGSADGPPSHPKASGFPPHIMRSCKGCYAVVQGALPSWSQHKCPSILSFIVTSIMLTVLSDGPSPKHRTVSNPKGRGSILGGRQSLAAPASYLSGQQEAFEMPLETVASTKEEESEHELRTADIRQPERTGLIPDAWMHAGTPWKTCGGQSPGAFAWQRTPPAGPSALPKPLPAGECTRNGGTSAVDDTAVRVFKCERKKAVLPCFTCV